MDKKININNLPELFISILFAGACSYVLVTMAEMPIDLNLEWLCGSIVLIAISILIISFIFDIKLININVKSKDEIILRLKLMFVSSITFTLFAFSRVIFHNRIFIDTNSMRMIWYIFIIAIIADIFILYSIGKNQDDENKRKMCYAFVGFSIFTVIILILFNNSILSGGLF